MRGLALRQRTYAHISRYAARPACPSRPTARPLPPRSRCITRALRQESRLKDRLLLEHLQLPAPPSFCL